MHYHFFHTGSDDYIETTNSFLFSLENNDGLSPFKMPQKQCGIVAVCKLSYGPTFGFADEKYDVHISENPKTSNTDPGHSYQLPEDYHPESVKARTLLAGSYYFTPSKIEVFWKTRS